MSNPETTTAEPINEWLIRIRFDATEAEARALLDKISPLCHFGTVASLRRDSDGV